MRLMPTTLAALAALSLNAEIQKPGASVPAKTTPEVKEPKASKQKDIVQLLKVMGWPAANAEAARKQLQAAAKDPKFASFPAAYWKDYESAATPEAFEKILVPLFEKTYSQDEIKALIKFMSTPEFKFFVEKNPDFKIRKEAYDGFSKYMTETGGKLREKHNIKVPPPVKK